MVLDVRQTITYHEFSPHWNTEHEAHMPLSDRMLIFCTELEKITVELSDLTEPEKNIYNEWTEKCQKNEFNFSNSYGLFPQQVEFAKVSLELI